jgi:hypothetical protein
VCCCCTTCDMEMFKFCCRICEFLPSPPVAYFQRGKSLLRFYAPWTQSATAFCQQHTVASQGGFYVMLHPCIRLSRRIYLLVCLLINMLCGRLGKCCNGHNHSIYCTHDVVRLHVPLVMCVPLTSTCTEMQSHFDEHKCCNSCCYTTCQKFCMLHRHVQASRKSLLRIYRLKFAFADLRKADLDQHVHTLATSTCCDVLL